MGKIGVFGGTFNPPHKGHILAACEAQKALGLDRVLFIPDAAPPHKNMPPDSPEGQTRLEMVRAAVRDLPWAEVSDIEITRSGSSYTADTLSLLKERYPEDTLYLLTGTDMFLSLHTWYHPEIICKHAVIVAMQRDGSSGRTEFEAQKKRLKADFGAKVKIVENRFVEVSSTHVRRLLVLGGAEAYVSPGVMEIIHNKGLYGTGRSYRGLSIQELREVSTGLLKENRVAHVLGCAETAQALARHYGADETVALRAGLLHDVTKAIDGEDQLLLVDKYDIMISDFERTYPKVLHAKTGAAVAEQLFGECPEVVSAIYWHTTGKPHMTLMEKIIYLADYIEPTRNFEGVEELRATAYTDLDLTLLHAFDMVLEELIRENKRLCDETPAARAFLAEQLGIK